MKKIAFLAIALMFVVACKKDSPKKVEKTMIDGSWKVELFSEDGVDETSYFAGYIFTFNDNGTVTATNGSTSVNGTWSTSDSSSDDDSSSDTHFNLSFPTTNNFDELTDDWHVKSLGDSKIELEDISGGDGSIDLLTFSK